MTVRTINMGLNDEYSRDAYNTVDDAYDSEGSDEFDPELHPEDWQDMYSQEILDGWMHLRSYLDQNYIKIRAGYPQFVELVLNPSKWYTNDAKLKLKKSLIEQIKKKESLGYDASELKLRLTKLEEEEALLAIQAKEKLAIDMANKAKNKKVSKLSNNALAKERERRKSLGYDE